MTSNALLLVMMEPPASFEDEFNDWYDTEHFPQRRSMPGFLSASRWICLDGWPRWIALYELASVDALHTREYLAVSGEHSTPWSRRMLARTTGRRRVVAEAIADAPGGVYDAGAVRLLVAHYPGVTDAQRLAASARQRLEGRNDVASIRAYVEADEAAKDQAGDNVDDTVNVWLLVAFAGPANAAAFHETLGVIDGAGASVFNLYAPYVRQWGGGR